MKKEQTLLVVCAVVAGLLVWSNVGSYEAVGAEGLPRGRDAETSAPIAPEPFSGLDRPAAAGRSLLLQERQERRKERPLLEPPPPLPLVTVRPLPLPAPGPAHWAPYRQTIVPKARPRPADETEAARPEDAGLDEEQPFEDPSLVSRDERERIRKEIEDSAKLVFLDGREIPIRIRMVPPHTSAPVWKVLEDWPRVPFHVFELNEANAQPRGDYLFEPAERVETVRTVRLSRSLENDYHTERIRRRLAEGDRQGLVELAKWTFENLRERYGLDAVRLAIGQLERARAMGEDLALVRLLGEYHRAAYDLEGEAKLYESYRASRPNEPEILVLLGDVYRRSGALHASASHFRTAAEGGDLEARLRLGEVLLEMGERAAAADEFRKAQGSASPAHKARALAGLAHVRLLQGELDEALSLAQQARQADGTLWSAANVLGAAQYAKGRFGDAAQTFAAASALESRRTFSKSNRGLALVAENRLAEAEPVLRECLAQDPLNYFDPLCGLGEMHQRWDELTQAIDAFELARQRKPRDPWILLRLATLRLQGGQPEVALALVDGAEGQPGLLQLAPESVDALRQGGLAALALEDLDKATRYLGRALEKEPRNADLAYEYARTLLLAGRAEEALRLLERITDVGSGMARGDGRVLALYGYALFTANRPVDLVFQEMDRARRGQVKPEWVEAYLEEAGLDVRRWEQTRIWRDEFERTGQSVGNGWAEDELQDVRIGLQSGQAVFSGRISRSGEGRKGTWLHREEDPKQFSAAEWSIKLGPGNYDAVCHLVTGDDLPTKADDEGGRRRRTARGAELGIGRDRNGVMTLYSSAGSRENPNEWQEIPLRNADGSERLWPTDSAFHTIRIELVDPRKGLFELYFDGERIVTEHPQEVGGLIRRELRIGVLVDGPGGVGVEAFVDYVEVERILR